MNEFHRRSFAEPEPHRPTIEAKLRHLAGIAPRPGAAAHAVDATRAALLRMGPALPRRRWIPMSLAASIALIIAGVLLFQLGQSKASAADQLRSAVATSQGYEGWVTITSTVIDPSTHSKTESTGHLNVADGIEAWTRGTGEDFEAGYQDAKTGAAQFYNAGTHTIRIGELAPDQIARIEHPARSLVLTYKEMLARLASVIGKAPQSITMAGEGSLTRYDLTAAIEASEAQLKSDSRDDLSGERADRVFELAHLPRVVWVDAQSGRIRKTVSPDGTDTYSYGDSPIASIYDLGVPRSAKIYDNRPTHATRDILQRIDGRIGKAFNNAVCVNVQFKFKGGQQFLVPTSFRLYARAGEDWFMRMYAVGQNSAAPGGPAVELPEHWSTSGAGELLKRLRNTTPQVEWRGNANEVGLRELHKGNLVLTHRLIGKTVPIIRRHMGPGYDDIFPLDALSARYGADNHVDLVHDAARPGQVGLHVTLVNTKTGALRAESFFWIDPAHDDRPVTFIETSFQADGKSVVWKGVTEFSDYADAPGLSYPTRWVRTDYAPSPGDKTHALQASNSTTTAFVILAGENPRDLLKSH